MYILRIEHPVPDFDAWKKAFDSDPVGRVKRGVRRYTVSRPTDDQKYVLVDLEFNTLDEAEAMLASLRVLWKGVEGKVMISPTSQILNVVEVTAIKQ